MKFRYFFTPQRYVILAVGLFICVVSLIIASNVGHDSELGTLLINLAASAITVVATALVIEYVQFVEESHKTRTVADIAEGEIQAICFRVKQCVVRLYGFKDDLTAQDRISDFKDAAIYLDITTQRINQHYRSKSLAARSIDQAELGSFVSRVSLLVSETTELVSVFQGVLPHSLQERVLGLRSDLQIAERMLRYVHVGTEFGKENRSLTHVTARSLFDSAQLVLTHPSWTEANQQLEHKPGRLARRLRRPTTGQSRSDR